MALNALGDGPNGFSLFPIPAIPGSSPPPCNSSTLSGLYADGIVSAKLDFTYKTRETILALDPRKPRRVNDNLLFLVTLNESIVSPFLKIDIKYYWLGGLRGIKKISFCLPSI